MRSIVLALSLFGLLSADAFARREEVTLKDAEHQIEVNTVCRGNDDQIAHCKKNLRVKFREAVASAKKARAHETAAANAAAAVSAGSPSPRSPAKKERAAVKVTKEVLAPTATNGTN